MHSNEGRLAHARAAGCLLVACVLLLPGRLAARPIAIGTIGDAAEQIERLAPFASYLAEQLREEGITSGRVLVTDGVFEMAELIREARIDVYIDSPLTALAVAELSGSPLSLHCAGGEGGDTRSVILVRREDGISDLRDLNGRTVAFEGPFSTFGYLLPKGVLAAKGADLRRVSSSGSSRDGTIGYVFSGDDENTIVWLLRGKVSAGAMSAAAFDRHAKSSRERLQILHETPALPPLVVSVRGTLPDRLASGLSEIVRSMEQREDGKRILQRLGGVAHCEPVTDRVLTTLGTARPFLHAELGIR